MFSVLAFAYMIRGKLSQNMGSKIFLCIVIGISAALLYQLTLSTQKLQSSMTGTKVEYMETDPNLNISISICSSESAWPYENITELNRFDSIFQRGNADTEWTDYTDTMSEMFLWKGGKRDVFLCKTLNFTEEEVKIVHSFRVYHVVFLHDPSFITSGTSLKLTGPRMQGNKIFLLNAKKIQSIEEENVCSNWIEFDSCRDDYIAQEFNNTFGCIFFNMK